MLNIKEEIQVILLRNGLSMRKLVEKMNDAGHPKMTIGGFSRMLVTKSIRFAKVQEVLDFLGYELIIKKKEK
ncbi:hypothetical protein IJ732_07580 [bacterium]|nr:hypothetical protein [bacterium]